MGAWGTGLYANDTSSDVRDTFKEFVRLPFSEEELIEALLEKYPTGNDHEDEEFTDFWLTVADMFHAYGFQGPEVFERARAIVETGADLDMKRDLEMEESDLRKRAKVLEQLAEKWRTPNPKPRKRNVMKAPEDFLYEAGDCVVHPTELGNGAPAYMSSKEIDNLFRPDGWGAFVVLATARRYGYWACYLVAKLHLEAKTKPSLETCRDAVIGALDLKLRDIEPDALVKTVTISKAEAKKLRLEVAGRFDLNQDALKETFADRYELVDDPYWSIPGLLSLHHKGLAAEVEHPVPQPDLPMTRFLR